MADDLLRAEGLRKSFPTRRNLRGRALEWVHAVEHVDLTVKRGETLAVVGESGAGKSTVGRLLLRLIEPDAGTVTFDGEDLRAKSAAQLRAWRRHAQLIFQDAFGSLDPRMTVRALIAEPLILYEDLNRADRNRRVLELLERVELGAHHADRYPFEFSGGQLQRISIARAIATNPALIVCDEPVSALDVSIRAQVINLLQDLQEELGISYVFVSHDLSLVGLIAHRIAIMFKGRVVEIGETRKIFDRPTHPYTRALLAAVPIPDPARARQWVRSTTPVTDPSAARGCAYVARCPHAMSLCTEEAPALAERDGVAGHRVACHLATELSADNSSESTHRATTA